MTQDSVTYGVNVVRDGKWWMVRIPELDGLTQARRLSEVETMAREWIAVTRDLELADVAVSIRSINVAGSDVMRTRDSVADKRRQVAALEREIADINTAQARALAKAAVPVRDIAEVLGVSFQRVSQIINA